MHHKSIHPRTLVLGFLAAVALPCQATTTILPGFDLFETTTPTTFNGTPFIGVPLGTFNFGGTIGIKPTGTTDTIVQRLGTATFPGPGTAPPIPIELVQLQLVSAAPVDMGFGFGLHFMTLQSNRSLGEGGPGPDSAGQMTVTFGPEGAPHGTFDSFFDVFFDLRIGAPNAPIVFSNDLIMSSTGVPWSHQADPGALHVNGANQLLNGTDISNDFWPVVPFTESHPSGAQHSVINPTPEPSISILAILGCGTVLWRRRR